MIWLSAEKQPSILFEFFNRIDPKETLVNTRNGDRRQAVNMSAPLMDLRSNPPHLIL
jgi:hypothetical protein